jgi:hypothetical protein
MSIRIYQPARFEAVNSSMKSNTVNYLNRPMAFVEQAVPAWYYYFGERSTTNTTNHDEHDGIKTFVVPVVVRCVRCALVFA